MDWKKLFSKLIWIAALVFLAWYFLWPVPLDKAMAADLDITISVISESAEGRVQTVYQVPAGTAGHTALRELLAQYPCRRTITASSKNTDQSFRWEQQILIQSDSGDAIYTYGSSKLTLNNAVLHNKNPESLHIALLDLLQAEDLGLINEGSQPVTTTY